VWEKLTNYMEIEPRWVANRPGNYMASTEDLVAACDENTIGEASGWLLVVMTRNHCQCHCQCGTTHCTCAMVSPKLCLP
jgi:glutamate/tyrosine decarboxylase-like PLP-dependent enzyme